MKTYIIQVDRPFTAVVTKTPDGRKRITSVETGISDKEFAKRIRTVTEAVEDILREEGGKLHNVLNNIGCIFISASEETLSRIANLEYVARVSENRRFQVPPSPGIN